MLLRFEGKFWFPLLGTKVGQVRIALQVLLTRCNNAQSLILWNPHICMVQPPQELVQGSGGGRLGLTVLASNTGGGRAARP